MPEPSKPNPYLRPEWCCDDPEPEVTQEIAKEIARREEQQRRNKRISNEKAPREPPARRRAIAILQFRPHL